MGPSTPASAARRFSPGRWSADSRPPGPGKEREGEGEDEGPKKPGDNRNSEQCGPDVADQADPEPAAYHARENRPEPPPGQAARDYQVCEPADEPGHEEMQCEADQAKGDPQRDR